MAKANESYAVKAHGEEAIDFRNILLQSPSIFLVLQGFPEMVISFANAPLYKSWGKTPDILGKPLLDVLPELRDQHFPSLLKHVFETGETYFGYEEKAVIHKDGGLFTVYYNYVYQAIIGDDGHISGVIVMANDITVQVEKRLDAERKGREFSAIADHLPALVWIADPQGQIVYYNNHINMFSGVVRHDEIWIWQGMVHPEDLAPTASAWNKAISEMIPYEVEHRLLMKDGSYRWYLTNSTPQKDSEGKAIKWIGTTTDIHKQKLLEKKLIQNEKRYKSLAKATTSIIWTTNAEGEFVDEQPSWQDYTGQTWDEYKGWGWANMLHQDERAKLEALWIEAVDQKKEYESEGRIWNAKTREYRHFLSRAIPLKDESGDIVEWVGMNTDIHDQKLAELKIRENEERFRMMADSSPMLVWILNAEGRSIYYNKTLLDFLGQQDILNGVYQQELFVHPDDQHLLEETLGNAIKERSPFSIELRIQRKDGEWRWLMSHGSPRFGTETEFLGFIGSSMDITERKDAEQLLKLAKEQLELIFTNVPAAISLFSTTGELIDINEKSAKIWGMRVDDLRKSKDLRAFVAQLNSRFLMFDEKGNHLQPQNSATAIALRTKEPAEVLVELVERNSKKTTWLLSRSSPLFDETGSVKMILNISTDITDQKKSEKEIRQSEKRFRNLIDAFPQMAWTASPDGKGTYFNQVYYTQTGLNEKEAMATGIVKALHPDDRQRLHQIWNIHLKSGQPVDVELRISPVHKSDYNWYLLKSRPVRDDNGILTQWISTCTNIQHLKDISALLEEQVHVRTLQLEELNAKLEAQARELKTSNEDLQQFAHVASHDLKEPVRKIKTYSNRLRTEFENEIPSGAEKYLEKIERSSERLFDLIDGILQYSSLDIESDIGSEVDVNELIRLIELDLEITIKEKQATIQSDPIPHLKGSPVLLHQLFYNLISNSLKFSRSGVAPFIEVCYKPGARQHGKDKMIEILVKDNGIGFNPAQSEKIFKTFTRLHSRDHYEGTGLGLALCKKIVERHNGTITAEGNPGIGSIFRIRLPLFPSYRIEHRINR